MTTERYRKTHKQQIKDSRKKYKQSHPERVRDSKKRYTQRNKEKVSKYNTEYQKKYKQTENGKIHRKKYKNKYKNKNVILILPNIFPKDVSIDHHHIDGKLFVAPLPSGIHRKINGRNTQKHIEWGNNWIEFYYDMNPVDFLKEFEA